MSTTLETKTETLVIPPGDSSWAIARRQFKKDGVAVFALVFLVVVAGVALFSPILANSKPVVVSYQGGLHFPAFKDYLDENVPIWDLGGWLRRTIPSVFSPVYPSIKRPSWQQLPDWRAIRREIDETGKGWYLLPPVPYYYNEDSSGIKLYPSEGMAHLELAAHGDLGAETLEFVPRRPAEQEQKKIQRRLGPGVENRARFVFNESRKQWTVEDPTTLSLAPLENWKRDWEDATEVDAAGKSSTNTATWHSTDEGHAARITTGWRWRSDYLAPSQELERTPRALKRALAFWSDSGNGSLAPFKHKGWSTEWTTVAGMTAIEARFTPIPKLTRDGTPVAPRLTGPETTADTLWLLFGRGRVFSVLVSAPFERRELKDAYVGPLHAELAPHVKEAITITAPLGNSTVEGQAITGRRFLNDGDALSLAGLKGTYVRQQPFILGSDSHGRCVLSRLIHGTVIAASVGLVSVGIYVTIGVILGALAGYYRGWVDLVISRIIEIVICFPTLFLIILIAAVVQKKSIYLIMVALGLIRWTGVARLVRGEILKTMSEEYVSAAKAMGLPTARIIFRHILPNSIAPVFVSASFGVAGAILVESSLSFLGFGVAPPTASWGEILGQGKEFVNEGMYHLVWAPGICIFVTVTMFNLVGEGLRDALDPKLRQ